jgi:diacylglycerol kinase
MVRFLDKNYNTLNLNLIKREAQLESLKAVKYSINRSESEARVELPKNEVLKIMKEFEDYPNFLTIRKIEKSELNVEKRELVDLYLANKFKIHSTTFSDDMLLKSKIDINRIVEQCLINGFFESITDQNSSKSNKIKLTKKGKDFASFDSLIYSIIQNIGKLWVLLAAILTSATFKLLPDFFVFLQNLYSKFVV